MTVESGGPFCTTESDDGQAESTRKVVYSMNLGLRLRIMARKRWRPPPTVCLKPRLTITRYNRIPWRPNLSLAFNYRPSCFV